MVQPFIKVEEVVRLTTLSKSTIYALVGTGEIPHLRLGSRVVFDPQDLERWIESRRYPTNKG